MDPASSRVVRFGAFEADLAARELRKRGVLLKLQDQPFRVLEALLEKPGEIVTREELKERLWAQDEFVEFDKSLNTAVQKIRQALDDSPSAPRFLETVPRHGYRFVAPVARRDAELQDASTTPPPRSKFAVAAGSVAIAALLAGLAYSILRPLPPKPPAVEAARPIASFQGVEYGSALSPDGAQVAFVWDGDSENNYDVYVRQLEGGGQVRLTTDSSRDLSPTWSPDGQWVAFCREIPSAVELYRVPSIGGPERRIASFPERRAGPFSGSNQPRLDWSSDGIHLAFRYGGPETHGAGAGVYSVSVGDGSSRLLHPALKGDILGAALSPDGSRIAYYPGFGNYAAAPIYVLALQPGSAPREIVRRTRIQGLDWTPDGRSVVFSQGRKLHRVPADGGDVETIAGLAGPVAYPSIASRGSGLVFDHSSRDVNIWRVPLDPPGGGAGEAFLASTRLDTSARFSPDGAKIVFVSSRTGSHNVWSANSDGSDAIQLTQFEGAVLGSPDWSPDGESIAFDSDRDGDQNVYVIPASGGDARRLTLTPAWEAMPSWSRDGRWIYFASDRSGEWRVWKKRADGSGEEVRVTNRAGRQSFESFDGKSLFFAEPWHRNGIWRQPLGGDEAELLLPGTGRGRWQVTGNGIYYLEGLNTPHRIIKFYDFDSQRSDEVYRFPDEVRLSTGSFRVSPDGRTMLYARIDHSSADIMYVPGFR